MHNVAWGFGKWSADMVAMSFRAQGRSRDLAIRKGIETFSGGNEKTKNLFCRPLRPTVPI